jgi:hypothetical protein
MSKTMPDAPAASVWILTCHRCARSVAFDHVAIPIRPLAEWATCCGQLMQLETTERYPAMPSAPIRKIDRLTVGTTVIFTRKPLGSWLSVNVPYVIEANGGQTVQFRNPVTGGGTYDTAADIEHAEFTLYQAAGGESTDA